MSSSSRLVLTACAVAGCALMVPARTALAYGASSGVVEAIEKKYVVTEMAADKDQVTKDGTTMSLKCAGIYGMPASSMMSTPPDNKVVDGKVQAPNMMMKYTLVKFGAHVLQTGDKVYITKIDSKSELGGDVLKFSILTVDSLDVSGQDSKKKYDATVSFKFKKGYLDETPPDEVEQAIEAVMAPDTGSEENTASAAPGKLAPQAVVDPPPARAAAPPPPPPPPAPAAPPPTISIGESSTQVLQALGMPQQMIDLGKKKTYIYKNMKVVFVDDKVTDVQ